MAVLERSVISSVRLSELRRYSGEAGRRPTGKPLSQHSTSDFTPFSRCVLTRYIFVTGGVVSSLGKGIAAASIGRMLKSRGLSVSVLKLDPYLNVDPGTMSPYQHGEVFVHG